MGCFTSRRGLDLPILGVSDVTSSVTIFGLYFILTAVISSHTACWDEARLEGSLYLISHTLDPGLAFLLVKYLTASLLIILYCLNRSCYPHYAKHISSAARYLDF